MTFRTRFAPSPTGPLHLGHAYSALRAWDMAQAQNGEFLLRIEDIDQSRARAQWEAQIYDDLAWLGLSWPTPVMRQSDRMTAYHEALQQLWDRGALFSCRCNRRDIAAALSAPQEGVAPVVGPDGPIYPGTCRANRSNRGKEPMPSDTALRLLMTHAAQTSVRSDHGNGDYSFDEIGQGPKGETGRIAFSPDSLITGVGDVVLARRDMGTSYHLSVVLDDAAQGITHVVRGEDLFEASKIHVLLQALLGLPSPIYAHHKLVRDDAGKRLAKRDDARAISLFRAEGATPADIRAMVGL